MSKPITPYIKLAPLYLWLQEEGFHQHTIKELVRAKIIPRTILPGRTHAYYHVPAVALALSIANPLTNSEPTNPHHHAH